MVGPLIRHWHGAISSGLGQLLLLREKALARSEERIITHEALKRARNKYRPNIETNLSVKEVKSSFEMLPNGTTAEDPKIPMRTSSFHRAIEQGQKCPSLGKLSKSTSSLENVLDEDNSNVAGFFRVQF